MRSYVVAAFVLCIFAGAGCAEKVSTPQPIFDLPAYTPTDARDVGVIDLDLDGNGVLEKVMTYTLDDVPVGDANKTNMRDTVEYLVVYRYADGTWYVIKQDQKNKTWTPGSYGSFCQVEVVTFDGAARDFLLVRKCHLGSGDEGYYLFGWNGSAFADIAIAKAYFDPDAYLTEPGDEFMTLEGVEAVSDGLIEEYSVTCTEGETCRALDVHQLFIGYGFITKE